eukprot:scaffold13147_cov61-Phaeocystis_antarctica.AAC.1
MNLNPTLRGARERRGVLGAEPLRDGLALVGEAVRRADGVGHDFGCDWAHVVVGHLHCLVRLRRAGRPAAAALAATGHLLLQRVDFCRSLCCRLCCRRQRRRRCRRHLSCCCQHRCRCHGLLTCLGHRRRQRPNPLGFPGRNLPRLLCHHPPRRLCRRLPLRLALGLLRLPLGLLLRLQQPVALGPRLNAHGTFPHLAWRRC